MAIYAEINILDITVENLDITIEHIRWLSHMLQQTRKITTCEK